MYITTNFERNRRIEERIICCGCKLRLIPCIQESKQENIMQLWHVAHNYLYKSYYKNSETLITHICQRELSQ